MTVGSEAIISTKTKEEVPPLWQRVSREVSENKFAYLLLAPSVLVFIALVLYPLANTIIGAFSETDAVGRVTHFGTLANFQELIDDSYIPSIISQTVIFVFGSVILTVLLSLPMALVLNQQFPGVIAFRSLLLLPWAAPLAISAMTWRWIYPGQLRSQ